MDVAPEPDLVQDPHPDPPRRSQRDRRPPVRYVPGGCSVSLVDVEPRTYRQAMQSPYSQQLKEACMKEMENFKQKGVWDIVDRPTDSPVVGGRWHFNSKINVDGSIAKFKARYVAKGFTQTEGVDYTDTFAATGRLTSLRALIAIAANRGWQIHAMDAIAAFLNSVLKETIFMELPDGHFEKEKAEGKVARLRKAVYGLKQLARCWSDEVKAKFIAIGLKQNHFDPCLWYRKKGAKESLIYLHVDDMAISGNEIEEIKDTLKLQWSMDDLGIARTIVGIEVKKLVDGSYSISQKHMIENILEKFNMKDCRPASTPFPGGTKTERASDEDLRQFQRLNLPYRSLIGSLMYISVSTRPDITYSVGVLSQHLERPSLSTWNLALHVLRYLRGTTDLEIRYNKGGEIIEGNHSWSYPECYVDSDWAGDKSSRRSTTGYLFSLNGAAISWRSRLQPTVALSSTEAEYRAATEAGQEVVRLRGLLQSINISQSDSTPLYCDNKGATDLAVKQIYHARTKHVEVQHHWIREKVSEGIIKLIHIPSDLMKADLLTKALHPSLFLKFRQMSGLLPDYS